MEIKRQTMFVDLPPPQNMQPLTEVGSILFWGLVPVQVGYLFEVHHTLNLIYPIIIYQFNIISFIFVHR